MVVGLTSNSSFVLKPAGDYSLVSCMLEHHCSMAILRIFSIYNAKLALCMEHWVKEPNLRLPLYFRDSSFNTLDLFGTKPCDSTLVLWLAESRIDGLHVGYRSSHRLSPFHLGHCSGGHLVELS